MKKLKQIIFSRLCVICASEYATTSSWGKYCSDACRQKAFRQRRANHKLEIVTQLHNVVQVLRNNPVTDNCRNCNKKRTLLEQTVNRRMCFDCFYPNWCVIDNIKNGCYPNSLYPDEPLIKAVENGEFDDYHNEIN